MKSSYIVPIWIQDEETLQIVKNAIESFKQATPDAELVLFDNGSAIGGGYLRSEARVYLRVPKNVGYTSAINYGISVAGGDIIAIVNDDIRISPNWLSVAEEILKDKEIATLHPRMTNYDVPFSYGSQVVKQGKERWCQNSCVFTTRRFLDEFRRLEENEEPNPGRFDESYGIGGGADDWDFYFRLRKQGYKTCYTDKACFQHLHSFSLKKLGEERQKIVEQNKAYFLQKHGFYPEDQFAKEFPEQMEQDYQKGFNI